MNGKHVNTSFFKRIFQSIFYFSFIISTDTAEILRIHHKQFVNTLRKYYMRLLCAQYCKAVHYIRGLLESKVKKNCLTVIFIFFKSFREHWKVNNILFFYVASCGFLVVQFSRLLEKWLYQYYIDVTSRSFLILLHFSVNHQHSLNL